MSLRSKWAAGKARAGRIQHQFDGSQNKPVLIQNVKLVLDVTDEQRSRRPIFNPPGRGDITIICETVHQRRGTCRGGGISAFRVCKASSISSRSLSLQAC
jgi:hypothetical protein